MLFFPENLQSSPGVRPGGLRYRHGPRMRKLDMDDGSQHIVFDNKEAVDLEEVTIWGAASNVNTVRTFYNQVGRTRPFWFNSQLYNKYVLARFTEGGIR